LLNGAIRIAVADAGVGEFLTCLANRDDAVAGAEEHFQKGAGLLDLCLGVLAPLSRGVAGLAEQLVGVVRTLATPLDPADIANRLQREANATLLWATVDLGHGQDAVLLVVRIFGDQQTDTGMADDADRHVAAVDRLAAAALVEVAQTMIVQLFRSAILLSL
jgi:hypothetical protein